MKNKKFYTYLVAQIFVLFLFAATITQSFAVQSDNADDRPEKIFYDGEEASIVD